MFVAGAGFEVDGHLHGEVLTTRLATIVYNQPCNTLVQQYLSADSTILTALIFFLEACFAIVCFPSLLFLPFNLFFLFFLTAKCSSSNSKFKASSSTLSADFVTWIWHSVDMGVWRYDLVVHWSEWKVNQTEPTHWYSPPWGYRNTANQGRQEVAKPFRHQFLSRLSNRACPACSYVVINNPKKCSLERISFKLGCLKFCLWGCLRLSELAKQTDDQSADK